MSWHPEPTEEEKRLLEIITPYVKLHGGGLREDAPEEVKAAQKRLWDISIEQGQ